MGDTGVRGAGEWRPGWGTLASGVRESGVGMGDGGVRDGGRWRPRWGTVAAEMGDGGVRRRIAGDGAGPPARRQFATICTRWQRRCRRRPRRRERAQPRALGPPATRHPLVGAAPDHRGGARRLHRLLDLDLLLRSGAQPLSEHANYLSPFFSPLVWKTGPVTPALWVLWAPLGFRATCYYYRKSYYRAFFWDPPACADRRAAPAGYRGETSLPMVLNNLHRFFWYPAAIVVVFLWVDAFASFDDNGHLYLGLGTLILLINAVLLSGYSFGCHAFRHLAGGGLDCFSCSAAGKARFRLWRVITCLQRPPRHLGLGQHVQRGDRRGLHPPAPGGTCPTPTS